MLDTVVQGANNALNGVASVNPYIASNVSTWGSGAPSDGLYFGLGTDLSQTNTTLTVTGQSAATAQALGATPSGPTFTLTFNADGTINEAIQSVTLDRNSPILDGNNDVTITGVLSVGPGISASIAPTSLVNGGSIDIGDPTALTISGSMQNNGLIEIAAGSTLDVTSPVTDDPTQVASETSMAGGAGASTSYTAQGVLSLGSIGSGPISWVGTASAGLDTYDRMGTDFGAVTNPTLTALGAPEQFAGLVIDGQSQGQHGVIEPRLFAVTETISYVFSSPVPVGTPFLLLDPGEPDTGYYEYGNGIPQLPGLVPNNSQHRNYFGPFTYSFTATLNGQSVSTAGWSFDVVSPDAGSTPLATYSIDAAAGTITVSNTNVIANWPDAVIVVTPNTPIDALQVTANTSSGEEWGLALPSPGGQIQIGDGATAEFDSSVDANQTVAFGNNASLDLTDTNASFNAVISDFTSGDIIHYTNLSLALGGLTPTGGQFPYSFTDVQQMELISDGSIVGDLNFAPNVDITNLTATPDGTGGTYITLGSAACYLAGTRIATPCGEISVEALTVGDLVQAQDAGTAPIKWIGHRRVDCRRHPKSQKVWPVRVRAGAFGDGAPHRDLWLSPDHAVFVDDVLIPIKHLINGTSIEQVPVDEVTYYHIELEHHDLLLAEGLPAESYLDIGDRFNFENGGGPIALHPEFSARQWDTALMWEALACARLIVTGPELDAVRALVNSRAAFIGQAASAA